MYEEQEQLEPIPSLTYRVENGRVLGKVDGLQAMRQAITKLLQTERFIFPIYSDQYGHDLNDLIGKELPYVETVLENVIKETLLFDDRVDDVVILEVIHTDKQSLNVTISVATFYGKIQTEVVVAV